MQYMLPILILLLLLANSTGGMDAEKKHNFIIICHIEAIRIFFFRLQEKYQIIFSTITCGNTFISRQRKKKDETFYFCDSRCCASLIVHRISFLPTDRGKYLRKIKSFRSHARFYLPFYIRAKHFSVTHTDPDK